MDFYPLAQGSSCEGHVTDSIQIHIIHGVEAASEYDRRSPTHPISPILFQLQNLASATARSYQRRSQPRILSLHSASILCVILHVYTEL